MLVGSLIEFYFPAHFDDFHFVPNFCPTRQNRLFRCGIFEPNLTVGAVAVPAKFTVRDGFHRKKLKTAQQRIVFGNRPNFAQNFNFDKLFKRLKNIYIHQLSVISYQLTVVKFWFLTAGR